MSKMRALKFFLDSISNEVPPDDFLTMDQSIGIFSRPTVESRSLRMTIRTSTNFCNLSEVENRNNEFEGISVVTTVEIVNRLANRAFPCATPSFMFGRTMITVDGTALIKAVR